MFFEDSAITFIIVEDIGFHELTFTFVVAETLLAFAIVSELIDGYKLLFFLFGVFIDLWLFAREHNGPYD